MKVDNLAKNIIYKELEGLAYFKFYQIAEKRNLYSDEYFIDYFLPKQGMGILIDVLIYTSLPIQKIFNKYIKILTNQKFLFNFLSFHKYKFYDLEFDSIKTINDAKKFLNEYIPTVVLIKYKDQKMNLIMRNFKEYIELYCYYEEELYRQKLYKEEAPKYFKR